MVKFGENSAKIGQIWENLRNFGEKQKKNQRFLTKILRLESGVQTPWNCVEEFGTAGNPNKGHSVCSQLDQTES